MEFYLDRTSRKYKFICGKKANITFDTLEHSLKVRGEPNIAVEKLTNLITIAPVLDGDILE